MLGRVVCPHLRSAIAHITPLGQPDQIALHECTLHGRCTIHPFPGYRDCNRCSDRPPGTWLHPASTMAFRDFLFPPNVVKSALDQTIALAPPAKYPRPTKLNLLYHIAPFADNDVWRWNVQRIKDGLDHFNGHITVLLATGEKMLDPSIVKQAFGLPPSRITFIERENDPKRWEAIGFIDLLRSVYSLNPEEATLYAHAKGVSRPQDGAALCWTKCMYDHLLGDVPSVKTLLESHPSAGVSFRVNTQWLYPGTFFWFRNESLFSQDGWDRLENPFFWEIEPPWYVEGYPNRFFLDGARIYPQLRYSTFDGRQILYIPDFWKAQLDVTKEDLGMPADSLAAIYTRYAHLCDKGTLHSYIEFYEVLLSQFKHFPITLVELGVQDGASLSLWRDYLQHPDSRVVGVDLVPPRQLHPGTEFIQADIDTMEGIPADIVIDDASHQVKDQINTFKKFWPLLRPGGYYVIEDIQSKEAVRELLDIHPFHLLDHRLMKTGRYDDIILWARK